MNPHSYRLKGRDFVHQGKIEIDVNERAVFIRTQGCFFVYTNSDCFLNSLLIRRGGHTKFPSEKNDVNEEDDANGT